MKWTDELIEQMFTDFRNGLSSAAIARRLGTTKNTIIGKYYRERVRRGLLPPPPSDKTPRPSKARRKQVLTLPARAESVSAYISPPVVKPDEGQLASIVDVTGCKWPVRDDPEFVGGFAFCNHAKADNGPYCPYHAKENVASYSRKLINRTLGSIGLRFGRRAAA